MPDLNYFCITDVSNNGNAIYLNFANGGSSYAKTISIEYSYDKEN